MTNSIVVAVIFVFLAILDGCLAASYTGWDQILHATFAIMWSILAIMEYSNWADRNEKD